MNNIQLAIMLEKYEMLLSKAIEDVKQELSQELVVEGKNLFGAKTESFPILEPLYVVLNLLDDDVELLKKNKGEENA